MAILIGMEGLQAIEDNIDDIEKPTKKPFI